MFSEKGIQIAKTICISSGNQIKIWLLKETQQAEYKILSQIKDLENHSIW